jgi:hypothetical protein
MFAFGDADQIPYRRRIKRARPVARKDTGRDRFVRSENLCGCRPLEPPLPFRNPLHREQPQPRDWHVRGGVPCRIADILHVHIGIEGKLRWLSL